MWILLPLAAAVGGAVWELVLRPASKTEVVQYDSSAGLVEANDADLRREGIDTEVFTNGAFHWIQVKPGDRAKAVAIVSQSARRYVANQNRIPG